MRFVLSSLEEIGVGFMIDHLSDFVDYLLNHFHNGVELSDKKSILRLLKTIWILVNPVYSIADLVQTKKLK